MPTAGLHRTIPALPVRDVPAAVAHYRERFRFDVAHQDAGFAVLMRDEAVLHLWSAGDERWRARGEPADRPVRSGAESFLAGTGSCRIEVHDVDALFEELEETGVLHPVSAGGIRETDFGTREFAALDADGNLLEFFRWTRLQDAPRPLAVAPGEGTAIQGPAGGPLVFKARGEQTGGALTVLENVIAPGDGPPLHVHAREAEAWWIVEGTLRFRLGEDLAEAPEGTFVFVPPGVPHAFQNAGETPARILVVFAPSGMERFFDAFAALPAGPEAFARAGREAAMAVVGPPMAVSHPA